MKLTLDIDVLTNDFFEGTRLFGIVAPIKDYMFCWQLNNLLGYNFRLNTDVEIQVRKKSRSYYFEMYQHEEANSFLCHYLYDNKHDGEYLLPEFKHIDFLWLMKGDAVEEQKCVGIAASIKSISGVLLVAELTNENFKNKQRLIF